MNILSQLKDNPEFAKNIKLEVSGKDLIEFANDLVMQSIEVGKLSQVKQDEIIVTPHQLAERLNVSLVTLWNWERKGMIKSFKLGNSKRFRYSEIKKIIQEYENRK